MSQSNKTWKRYRALNAASRTQAVRHGAYWSASDDETLLALWEGMGGIERVAAALGRTHLACRQRHDILAHRVDSGDGDCSGLMARPEPRPMSPPAQRSRPQWMDDEGLPECRDSQARVGPEP